MVPSWPIPYSSYNAHDILWYGISFGQFGLAVLAMFLPACCAPARWQSMGQGEVLVSGWALLSNNQNITVLSAVSLSYIQSMALYHLPRRKITIPGKTRTRVFDESIKFPLGSEIHHRTGIVTKSFSHLFLICHYTFLRALGCNALQSCPENMLAGKWIFNFCNVLQERMEVPQLIQILSRMFWNSLSSSTGVKMEHIIKMYWRKMQLSNFWNCCLLWKVQWVPNSPFHKN